MGAYEERILEIQGIPTRVLQGGEGPSLVYWHGAGGAGDWMAHHALLAERFTVYAPENPNWGALEPVEWMDSVQDYVLHYDSLFRALELEKPLLVGHSLGGWMAAEFAATYPERLSALALVNAAGMPFAESENLPDFFAMAARGGEPFVRMIFHRMDVAATVLPSQPTAEDRLRFYRSMTATARIAWNRWFEPKMPYRLRRIAVPTLVLWGAEEKLFPVALGQQYAEAIPHAEFVALAECGHMVPMEDPTAFAQEIIRLYERATP